jgi:hypothetical protein
MFVRSIKGAPSSILWVLVLVRRALSIAELETHTDYQGEAIRKALDVLSGYGMVKSEKRAHGETFYSISNSAQAMLLPGFAPMLDVARNPESGNSAFCADELVAIDAPQVEEIPDSGEISPNGNVENEPKTAKNDAESVQNQEFPDSGSLVKLSTLTTKESSKNLNLTRDQLKFVCKTAYKLFGHEIYWRSEFENRGPELFAWIAFAYTLAKHAELENPAGIVYKGMQGKYQKGRQPDAQYLEGPLVYLPKAWLEEFGLVDYECTLCGEVFNRQAERDQHQKQRTPEHIAVFEAETEGAAREWDPEFEAPAVETECMVYPVAGCDANIGDVWSAVLEHLQAEMPRASYETWVRDTVPTAWNDTTGELMIGCRNEYARQWMASRLDAQITRYLAEITHREIIVSFGEAE